VLCFVKTHQDVNIQENDSNDNKHALNYKNAQIYLVAMITKTVKFFQAPNYVHILTKGSFCLTETIIQA